MDTQGRSLLASPTSGGSHSPWLMGWLHSLPLKSSLQGAQKTAACVPGSHAPSTVSHEAMPVLQRHTIQFEMFILSHMLIPGPNAVAREWAMRWLAGVGHPCLLETCSPGSPLQFLISAGEWLPYGGREVQGRQKLAYLVLPSPLWPGFLPARLSAFSYCFP